MNEAIKLAIEKGGYETNLIGVSAIKLDPLFWQALGKALGWGESVVYEQGIWMEKAMDYMETLLTGGDTEKFWKDLLDADPAILTQSAKN